MTDIKYIKELIQTSSGTEGSLLIPKKIHDTLIEEVFKAIIPRSEAALYVGPSQIPGSSYDANLVTRDSMKVRRVAEGAEIPQDNATYFDVNLKPVKYGVNLRITSEMLEDSKWDLLKHNVEVAGRRLAENENSLVITELSTASNTITGGAAITVANITRAMQYLEDVDYYPTSFVVGYSVLKDIRNLDLFTEAYKAGNTDILETGFLGNIMGMKVFKVSTNAGMNTLYSYVYDKNHAYAIAEKRPLSVENFDLPTFDMKSAIVTQRIKVKILRSEAVCAITTTG